MTVEEVFGISLPDEECARIVTVGDLYRAVVSKPSLAYVPSSIAEQDSSITSRWTPPERRFLRKTVELPISPDPAVVPWTSPEVWLTIKAIIQDQLRVGSAEVQEKSTFLKDLRCD